VELVYVYVEGVNVINKLKEIKQIASLLYKIDNNKTDAQGKIVVGTIFFSLILFLFFRTMVAGFLLLLVVLIVLRLYFIPAGRLDFFYEDGHFYCENHIKKNSESQRLKIQKKKFRWSYNWLGTFGGDVAGLNSKEKAVNFPLLRLELDFENEKPLVICHELGQWGSVPHWTYELFFERDHGEVLLVSSKLTNLKEEMEKLEVM